MYTGVCHNLRSMIVKVSPSDYFEEPNSQEAQHLFEEILSTLKVCLRNDCALWLPRATVQTWRFMYFLSGSPEASWTVWRLACQSGTIPLAVVCAHWHTHTHGYLFCICENSHRAYEFTEHLIPEPISIQSKVCCHVVLISSAYRKSDITPPHLM